MSLMIHREAREQLHSAYVPRLSVAVPELQAECSRAEYLRAVMIGTFITSEGEGLNNPF